MERTCHCFFLAILALAGVLCIEAHAAPLYSTPSLEELRRDVEYLKTKYRDVPMMRDSSDRELFNKIGRGAQGFDQLIGDLIDLTTIKETRSNTDERVTTLGLSPAGRQLNALKDKAVPIIEKRIADASLTEGQREVLAEVLGFHEMRALQSQREKAERKATSVTAPQRADAPAPSPAPLGSLELRHVRESKSDTKRVWGMLLAAAALGLVFLAIRRRLPRKGSPRVTGS